MVFGIPPTIACVKNQRSEEIFQMLGIDENISATTLLFQLTEQEVAASKFLPLALLRRGDLEIVEMKPTEKFTYILPKPLHKLNLP